MKSKEDGEFQLDSEVDELRIDAVIDKKPVVTVGENQIAKQTLDFENEMGEKISCPINRGQPLVWIAIARHDSAEQLHEVDLGKHRVFIIPALVDTGCSVFMALHASHLEDWFGASISSEFKTSTPIHLNGHPCQRIAVNCWLFREKGGELSFPEQDSPAIKVETQCAISRMNPSRDLETIPADHDPNPDNSGRLVIPSSLDSQEQAAETYIEETGAHSQLKFPQIPLIGTRFLEANKLSLIIDNSNRPRHFSILRDDSNQSE